MNPRSWVAGATLFLLLSVAFIMVVPVWSMPYKPVPPPFEPKLLPEDSLPPYFVKFGNPLAAGYATLQEVSNFAGQMGGPQSPLEPYMESGLVVGGGAWADGYYWIWVSKTHSSDFTANPSLAAELVDLVNNAALSFGYSSMIPVKIAVATGTGGYLPLPGP
jgi:hypothetical protein